jgi:hypothetical protein
MGYSSMRAHSRVIRALALWVSPRLRAREAEHGSGDLCSLRSLTADLVPRSRSASVGESASGETRATSQQFKGPAFNANDLLRRSEQQAGAASLQPSYLRLFQLPTSVTTLLLRPSLLRLL